MKKTITKRVLSIFLAALMVMVNLPYIVINAAKTTKLENYDDFDLLGNGYNLLGTEGLTSSCLTSKGEIFDESFIDYVNAERTTGSEASYSYTYIKDMDSYLRKQSSSLNSSIGLNAKIKLFSLEAKFKMGITEKKSDFGSNSYEYAVLKANKKISYSHMDLQSHLNDMWKYNAFNMQFIEDAKNLGGAITTEKFIEKYGTHIICSYNSGGGAMTTYKNDSFSYAFNESTETNSELSVKTGYDGLISMEGNITGKTSQDSEIQQQGAKASAYGCSYGADGLIEWGNTGGDFSSVNDFFENIKYENSEILVDSSLELLPVWEVLLACENIGVDDSDIIVANANALKNYFNQNIKSQCLEFYDKYLGETYISDDVSEGVEEWLNESNVQIITTAQEFYDIRNDLDGVYVLANNIDLSQYENWVPIGTDSNPFKGKIYGNYNTISGLTITASDNEYTGLFGYSRGTIVDLKLEGNISVVASSDNYVGGIVAYNLGEVINCYDDVTHEINYSNVEINVIDIKLPLTTSEPIVIGESDGVRLIGSDGESYTGIDIVVNESSKRKPAYIILENACIYGSSLDGTIYSASDRPIYIVSEGKQNEIHGTDNAPGVNAPFSSVSIFGESSLIIEGGKGENGTTGIKGINGNSGSKTQNGKPGGTGGRGSQGKEGKEGIIAMTIYNHLPQLTICGGTGGMGGTGGTGGTGGAGGKAYWFEDGGDGGSGGVGGQGGQGGRGGLGVSKQTSLFVLFGTVEVLGGKGGDGGTGGTGGAGGAGGSGDGEAGVGGSRGATGYRGCGGSNGLPGDNSSLSYSLCKGTSLYISHLGYGDVGSVGSGSGSEQPVDGGFQVTCKTGYGDYTSLACRPGGFVAENIIDSITATPEKTTFVHIEYNVVYTNKGYVYIDGNLEYDTDYKTEIIVMEKSKESVTEELAKELVNWGHSIIQIDSVLNTKYYSGDSFDKDSVKIFVEGKEIEDYSYVFNTYCSKDVLTRTGYVKIIRDGYERYIPVYITRTIATSIEIEKTGKTEFIYGTQFDISGLSIRVKYNNGTEGYISEDNFGVSYVSPSIKNVGGSERVEIFYDHDSNDSTQPLSCYYDIYIVSEYTIGIKVIGYQYSYDQGDIFTTDDIRMVEIKNSGIEQELTADELLKVKFSVYPSLCNAGISTVTAKYKGLTTQYTIIVNESEGYDHSWDNGVIKVVPTHTTAGEMTYTCTVCGETKTEAIAPDSDNHDFGEWKEHTETRHIRECECGEKEYGNHVWNDGEVTKQPTVDAEGEKTYTCETCHYTRTEAIDRLPDTNTAKIVVNGSKVKAGETIDVVVSLENNPGFASLNLYFTYPEELTLVGAVNGVSTHGFTNDKTMFWDNTSDHTADGTLITLQFEVSDDAEAGDYTISAVILESYNENLDDVVFASVSGTVEVCDFVYGDVTGDDVINGKDVIMIRKYIAAKDPITGVSSVSVSDGADCNGDGVINGKDVILLRKYIAGKDPITGESSIVLGPAA